MTSARLDLGKYLNNVRRNAPLVHNITNYVTVNDCANILLACGGSPIMSDDIEDAPEITKICGGLNINIGTLNGRTIPAMFLSGKTANELGHPVLLDPVGAGASTLRTETARKLMDEVKFTAVRGNISEIKTLALGVGDTRGVDASDIDRVTEDNLEEAIAFIRAFAARMDSIVAVTGALDIVTDGKRAYVVRNGHAMMSAVTGTGCQLSALTTAYLVANPSAPLEATLAAVCAMGLCGEKAQARLTALDGNASYRTYIIDAMHHLTSDQLNEGAKYEMR